MPEKACVKCTISNSVTGLRDKTTLVKAIQIFAMAWIRD
jgi:hypothetical protein